MKVRFRIKKIGWFSAGYYSIQKKHWFGWCRYDAKDYFNLETAKARLREIKENYPNVRPKREKVLDEIEIEVNS